MRSMLFVPGDSARKMEKSLASGADAIILDLEDSVSPDNKQNARETTRAFLEQHPSNGRSHIPQLFVRVNPFDTGETQKDVDAVLPACPDGIVQPKTRSAADVERLSGLLAQGEKRCALDDLSTKIVVIATETAAALFHMGSYAECGPRLTGLSWGAEDLSADLGASTNKTPNGRYADPYRLARTLSLLAARAADVQPIDTVFTNFRNEEGFAAECEAAARDGFTGKLAIHPAQVPAINRIFTPSQADIERASRIVEAFDADPDLGVIGLDGEMIDRPHLVRARKLLDRAALYRLN